MRIRKTDCLSGSPFGLLIRSEPVLTLRLKAVAAVHGTVSARLERNLRLASAAVADHGEHLPGSAAVAVLGFAGVTAGLAPAGLILEALLGVEFLFAGRENKFVAAVTAGQSLVFVHGSNPPKKMLFTRAIGDESCPVPDNGYEKQPWRK